MTQKNTFLQVLFYLSFLLFFALAATESFGQQYVLYGTTFQGGANNLGTFFSYNTSTDQFTKIVDFSDSTGYLSISGVTQDPNTGLLYGLALFGGGNGDGTIFSYNTSTQVFQTVASFNGINGNQPYYNTLLYYNGLYYGLTYAGGVYGQGNIFSFNPGNDSIKNLLSFDDTTGSPAYPQNVQLTPLNGILYGLTNSGGISNQGTLFGFNPNTDKDSVYVLFNGTNGQNPSSSLLSYDLVNHLLYGTTIHGGTNNIGVIFSFDPVTSNENVLYNFDSIHGSYPYSGMMYDSATNTFFGETGNGGATNRGVVYNFNPGTNLTILASMGSDTTGAVPVVQPTLGPCGTLYIVTQFNGQYGDGALFGYNLGTNKIVPTHIFSGLDGKSPRGRLALIQQGGIPNTPPPPQANVTITASADTIHSGEWDTLTAHGAVSYIWSNGATTSYIRVWPATTTTYSVTGTDSNGCSAINSFKLNVISGNQCSAPIPLPQGYSASDYAFTQNQQAVWFSFVADSARTVIFVADSIKNEYYPIAPPAPFSSYSDTPRVVIDSVILYMGTCGNLTLVASRKSNGQGVVIIDSNLTEGQTYHIKVIRSTSLNQYYSFFSLIINNTHNLPPPLFSAEPVLPSMNYGWTGYPPTRTHENWLYNVIPAKDGGYVGCGYSENNTPTAQPSIVKINSMGQKEWDRVITSVPGFPGFTGGHFDDIIEILGNIYVAEGEVSLGNILIAKIDEQGNILNTYLIGPNGSGNSHISTINGNPAFLRGYSSIRAVHDANNNPDGYIIGCSQGETNYSNFPYVDDSDQAMMIKLDNNFNLDPTFNSTGYEVVGTWSGGLGRNDAARPFYNSSNILGGYIWVGSVNVNYSRSNPHLQMYVWGTAPNGSALSWPYNPTIIGDMTDFSIFPIHQFTDQGLDNYGYYSLSYLHSCSCNSAVTSPTNNDFATDIEQDPNTGEMVINAECDWNGWLNESALSQPCWNTGCMYTGLNSSADTYGEFADNLFTFDPNSGLVLQDFPVKEFDGLEFHPSFAIDDAGNFIVNGNNTYTVPFSNTTPLGVENVLVKVDASLSSIDWTRTLSKPAYLGYTNCTWNVKYCSPADGHDGGFVVCGNNELNGEDYFIYKMYSDCQPETYLNVAHIGTTNINTYTEWSGVNYTVEGAVTVEPGATLIIDNNSTVQFADTRQLYDFDVLAHNYVDPVGIIVKPGGTLIIDNSTLKGLQTCNSSDMWQGIMVEGNPNVGQQYTGVPGTLNLTNSTIQDAITGVLVNGANFDSKGKPTMDNLLLGGGDVYVNNTQFLNCQNSIHFTNYPYSQYYTSFNAVYDCQFINNLPLADPDFVTNTGIRLGNQNFISAVFCSGMQFEGNQFTSTGSFKANTPQIDRGDGIYSLDSRYFVIPDGGTPNSFTSLNRGVFASSASYPYDAVNISGNNFYDNLYGIAIGGTNNCTVNSNNFYTYYTPYFLPHVSLYMDNSTGFSIQDNVFHGPGITPPAVGAILNNCSSNSNLIYHNTFNSFFTGTQSQDNSTGLQILCNNYSNGKGYDISVTSNVLGGGIATQQGHCSFSPVTPANNTFSQLCPNNKDIWASPYSAGDIQNFTYNSIFGAATTPQSGCYTPPIINSTICGFFIGNYSICSDEVTVSLPGYVNNYTNANTQYIALKNTLAAGDAPSLLAIIATGTPGQIETALLAPGNYLSDRVLNAAMNKGLPPGNLKNILIPNSPLDSNVMATLDSVSLPNGISNQIMAAQTGASARETLEEQISAYNSLQQDAVNGMLRYYLADTIPGSLDSVIAILQRDTIPNQLSALASAQFMDSNFTGAENTISEMQTLHIDSGFTKLETILINLAMSGQNYEAYLTNPEHASQVSKIMAIAGDTGQPGSANALALLSYVFNQPYPLKIEQPFVPDSNARKMNPNDTSANSSQLSDEASMKCYPNPFTNSTTIEVQFNNANATGEIRIYGILGNLVKKYEISSTNNIIHLNSSGFSSGMYFCQLISDKQLIEVTKLMVDKK